MIRLPQHLPESPPTDNNYQAAVWLVGRHPSLARLLSRIPGAVDADDDLDVDVLGDALRALDAHRRAWADYRTRTWEPTEDAAWDRWQPPGPRGTISALPVQSPPWQSCPEPR